MKHAITTTLKTSLRAVVLGVAALGLAGGAQAQWHGHGGYHRGGGWHGAPWVWGGVGLGLGLGLASSYAWSNPYYVTPAYVAPVYAAPAYAYSAPTVVYTQPTPVPSSATGSSGVRPVIYPRNGQSAAQREADSDQCSQWAGQQPNATSDRSIFDRAVAACMDGRGYTLR